MTFPHWPLFDIRIRTERLELRLPTDEELMQLADLAAAGIHDPDDMPFKNAWTRQPSPQLERSLLQYHWSTRASWKPEDWTFALAVFRDDVIVGTQAVEAKGFAVCETTRTGSWLGRAHQGNGYGTEMRAAVLWFAFEALGANEARTDAFLTNKASIGVSTKLGYEADGERTAVLEGKAARKREFVLTRDRWKAVIKPMYTVEVTGFDGCDDWFRQQR
jgi:RimJ/RimL family protein N-acetyltransferase